MSKPHPQSTVRRIIAEPGQALVELAITLPTLLLVLVGLISIGLLLNSQIILTQAAWEGARAGATISDPAAGDAQVTAAVRSALSGLNADEVQIDIDPRQHQPPRNQPFPMPRGHPLTVTLRYGFQLYLPFGIEVPLTASATSRMEYQNP